MAEKMVELKQRILACDHCASVLPHQPRPVVQLHSHAKILIAGQAPGLQVHQTGIPFNDPSGDRLRAWMGITPEQFYDSKNVAILPLGFCYPGRGKTGDLPPRKECAPLWREEALGELTNIQLTLVVGQYALKWHFPDFANQSLTEVVMRWRRFWPRAMPLPHPSPRNNRWLKQNAWFEQDLIPILQQRISTLL